MANVPKRKTDMKTFKDLIFKPKKNLPNGKKGDLATLDFDNGYGVSVVTGYGAYTSPSRPYELAVIKNGDLCYDTAITSDVVGHLDAKGVTKIMKKIQKLDGGNGFKKLCKRVKETE